LIVTVTKFINPIDSYSSRTPGHLEIEGKNITRIQKYWKKCRKKN
jgi:hypothetical protein